MGKYKIHLKIKSVTITKKSKGILSATGVIAEESKSSCKADIVNHEAKWSSDNYVVKSTLHWKQSEIVVISLSTEKKVIGTITFDVIEYVNQVTPGGKGKFDITQIVSEKKHITMLLSMAVSREAPKVDIDAEDNEVSRKKDTRGRDGTSNGKANDRGNKGLLSAVTRTKSKSKAVSPRVKKTSHAQRRIVERGDEEEGSPQDSPVKSASVSPRAVRTRPSTRGSSPAPPETKVDYPIDDDQPKPNKHKPRKRNTTELIPSRVSNANSEESDVSGSNVDGAHHDTQKIATPVEPAHRLLDTVEAGPGTLGNSLNLTRKGQLFLSGVDESVPSGPKSPVGGRLVQGSRNSPFKPHKYATAGAATLFSDNITSDTLMTQQCNFNTLGTNKKIVKHTRGTNSDVTGTRTDKINVARLKQEYKHRQDFEAEKYLVDDIFMEETTRDLHVVAYITWKSLLQWDAFVQQNSGIHSRILTACERAVEHFKNSRTMLAEWLSTLVSLMYMAEEEKKDAHFQLLTDVEDRLQDFINHLHILASNTCEYLLKLMQERLNPFLKTVLAELISPSAPSIVQDDESSLAHFFVQLTDWVNAIARRCVFEPVKQQFISRVIHFLVSSVMDVLFSQGCSYSIGIQVKMFITKVEDWVRVKLGNDLLSLAGKELEPLRQAANVLCLLQKADLINKDFKEAVCALLRPSHVSFILEGYRSDQFDKEPVPQSVIDKIKLQEQTYQEVPDTFKPHETKPFNFSFSLSHLNLDKLALPKVILDKPGFSFLKRTSSNDQNKLQSW